MFGFQDEKKNVIVVIQSIPRTGMQRRMRPAKHSPVSLSLRTDRAEINLFTLRESDVILTGRPFLF